MPILRLQEPSPRATTAISAGAGWANAAIAKDDDGRAKLYADIAHPINSTCRDMIQRRVIAEFQEEMVQAKQDGYMSRYDDFDLETDFDEPIHDGAAATAVAKPHFQSARRSGSSTAILRARSVGGGGAIRRAAVKPAPAKPTDRPPAIRVRRRHLGRTSLTAQAKDSASGAAPIRGLRISSESCLKLRPGPCRSYRL